MAFWLAPVLAQVITFSAGDRTEFRTRVRPDVTLYDLETRPNVQVVAAGHRSSFLVAYAPIATRMAMGTDSDQLILMHTGRAEVSYRWRRSRLSLSQDASYGRTNYQALAVAATTTPSNQANAPIRPPTGLPTQLGYLGQTLVTGSSNTTLRVDYALSRRLQADNAVGYSMSGGLNHQSRQVVPVLRGPVGSSALRYHVTRTDDVSGLLSGYWMDSSSGRRPWLTVLEDRWDRQWSRPWASRLSAGAAMASDSPVLAVASASATMTQPIGRSRLQTSVETRLAPMIEPRSGLVDERMEANAAASWVRGRLSVLGRYSAIRSVHPNRPAGMVGYFWAAGMAYELNHEWRVETGVRGARILIAGANLLPADWAAYGAVQFATTFPSL